MGIDSIETLTDEELADLAGRLAPFIANELVMQPRVFGDRSRLIVGEGVSLVNTLFNLVSGTVTIGEAAFFGHDVSVLTGTHDVTTVDYVRKDAYPTSGRDIVIERGAWICSNATILGPCTIGRNAVVGVGSVVLGDVAADWFYAGIPARPVRRILG